MHFVWLVFFICVIPLFGKSAKSEFSLQMPQEVAKIYYEMKGLDMNGGENASQKEQNPQNSDDKKNKKQKAKEEKKAKKEAKNKNIEYFIDSKKSQKSAQTTHYFPNDVPPPIEQPPSFEEIIARSVNEYPQNQQLCQMGDKKACFFAGQAILYTGGDLGSAQQYYWLSCALGMQLACDEYSKISMSVDMLYRQYFQRWQHKVWVGDIITKKGKYIELQKVRPAYKIRNMQPR